MKHMIFPEMVKKGLVLSWSYGRADIDKMCLENRLDYEYVTKSNQNNVFVSLI